MRTRSLFRRWSLVMVPVMAVAAGGGCAGDVAGPESPDAAEQAVRYDGETLFRGLTFGDGPVAAALPELYAQVPRPEDSGLTQEQLQGIESTKTFLVSEIKRRDPVFFAAFADGIQSGDPVRVAAALDRSGRILTGILRDIERENSTAPDPSVVTGQAVWLLVVVVLAVAVVAAGAVNLTVAGNVNTAVNVNYVYNYTEVVGAEDDLALIEERYAYDREASKLRRDRAAALIALRLAVN